MGSPDSSGGGGTTDGSQESSGGWWDNIGSLDGLRDIIGGVLNTSLNILLSPLKAIGDALGALGSALGKGLDFIASSLGSLGSAIGEGFSNLGLSFSNGINSILEVFTSIGEAIQQIISWLNPFSKDFILKLAFIPSEQYMNNYGDELKGVIMDKFAVVGQIHDTIKALTTAIDDNVLGNDFRITIDLSKYGIGKQDIVSMTALNYYGEKIKFWISGFIYFLVAMWLYRKFSSVLGVGK